MKRPTLFSHLHETPTDTARRELTEHRAACDACIAGLDCPTGDDLDRRLTEAASGELPWPDTYFQTGNNSITEDKP